MLHKKRDGRHVRQTTLKTGIAAALLLSGIVYLQSCQLREGKPDIQPTANKERTIPSDDPVDVMPRPEYDLNEYLANRIEYPEEAKKKEIEGRVVVKFVVAEDGSIVDPVAVKSPDQSLSDEAVRVIRSMPNWTPGQQGGKNVNVSFALPIKFTLD